jgi:hypothetical protein
MSRVSTVTATIAVPNSPAVVIDHLAENFAVGFGCVRGGDTTFKVQHTFDDIMDASVTPTWFDHSSVTGKTANTDGNYAFPVRAIRVAITAGTTGTVVMTVIQAR